MGRKKLIPELTPEQRKRRGEYEPYAAGYSVYYDEYYQDEEEVEASVEYLFWKRYKREAGFSTFYAVNLKAAELVPGGAVPKWAAHLPRWWSGGPGGANVEDGWDPVDIWNLCVLHGLDPGRISRDANGGSRVVEFLINDVSARFNKPIRGRKKTQSNPKRRGFTESVAREYLAFRRAVEALLVQKAQVGMVSGKGHDIVAVDVYLDGYLLESQRRFISGRGKMQAKGSLPISEGGQRKETNIFEDIQERADKRPGGILDVMFDIEQGSITLFAEGADQRALGKQLFNAFKRRQKKLEGLKDIRSEVGTDMSHILRGELPPKKPGRKR